MKRQVKQGVSVLLSAAMVLSGVNAGNLYAAENDDTVKTIVGFDELDEKVAVQTLTAGEDDENDIKFPKKIWADMVVEKAEEEIMKMPGHHKLFVVGELGRHYFVSQGHEIEQNFQYTVQKPNLSRARIISETLMEQFNNGELDEVYVVYTRMENSMVSEVETVKLLPLERSAFGEDSIPANLRREAIQLYPSVESVMDNIVPNYVTGMIYGCLVEAYASEHNARMTAMKSATDSAEAIIKDLSIAYNRARQAAITQEITEVCAGAKAQKRKRK